MHWLLFVAALAVGVAAVGHAITGERDTLKIVAAGSPGAIDHVRTAWHLLTVLLMATAVVLAGLGHHGHDAGASLAGTHIAGGLGLGGLFVTWRTRGRNPTGFLLVVACLAAWLGATAH
ncbi:MAG: hypothetical protein HUU26_00410 [Gemmatimonadaceae bacterium]|nr:hypothetical protein [Gemmatimonadaceae bacterium]